jgi:hypothetical protein
MGPSLMPDNKASFKQDLIKILVDKVLIGIFLVIIGIFSTSFIEKLKSERSFSAELDKIRAEKIGEVWEKVYLYEAASKLIREKLILELLDAGARNLEKTKHPSADLNGIKDIKQEVKEMDEKEMRKDPPYFKENVELMNTLNKNRFWLGEDMFSDIEHYLAASEEYNLILTSRDENRIKDAEKKREASRATIIKIRDRLLKE